jgi:hypothetical protein
MEANEKLNLSSHTVTGLTDSYSESYNIYLKNSVFSFVKLAITFKCSDFKQFYLLSCVVSLFMNVHLFTLYFHIITMKLVWISLEIWFCKFGDYRYYFWGSFVGGGGTRSSSEQSRMVEWSIKDELGKDLEGSGCRVIEVLHPVFSRTEKNHGKPQSPQLIPRPRCETRTSRVWVWSWPRDTLYPLKLALTSPTCGGRSVGIVRWRTKAPEFVVSFVMEHSFFLTSLQLLSWLRSSLHFMET